MVVVTILPSLWAQHTSTCRKFSPSGLVSRPEQCTVPSLTSCRAIQTDGILTKEQLHATAAAGGIAACLVLFGAPEAAQAARNKLPPPIEQTGRCTLEALDRFADTRANFSQEASSGMDEAFVDVRGCDFADKDLTSKVFSGVLMRDADFHGANFSGVEFARADAKGANLAGANFTDVNGYGTSFDGANLESAEFGNAILTGATFGQWNKVWANLRGAHFEGALLSSSDISRMCENPTLEDRTKRYELGCRIAR